MSTAVAAVAAPRDWDRLTVSPFLDGIVISGTSSPHRPCVVDLTDVAELHETACELLCAAAWRCPEVKVIGGTSGARAAIVKHLASCAAVALAVESGGRS